MIDENDLSNMTDEEAQEFLKNIISPNSSKFDINPQLIANFREKQSNTNKILQERLEGLILFDHSDIRLNSTRDFSDGSGGFVMAICAKDHVELILKSWLPEFQYFQNIVFTLNHESIHAVIDKILLEDEFDSFTSLDGEYPFYAGGIDSMLGMKSSQNAPSWFLDDDAAKNTAQIFSDDYNKNLKNRDYDL